MALPSGILNGCIGLTVRKRVRIILHGQTPPDLALNLPVNLLEYPEMAFGWVAGLR
jgi:hypothetical protein